MPLYNRRHKQQSQPAQTAPVRFVLRAFRHCRAVEGTGDGRAFFAVAYTAAPLLSSESCMGFKMVSPNPAQVRIGRSKYCELWP
jgi:hypothetical protein